jgi:hypothetical protein
MQESIKLDLYYFNHKITTPIVFFIVKVFSEKEEHFLEKNTDFLFQTLIENNYAPSNSIVVFNILKEYSSKIINWILPSKTTNFKILQQIEKDNNLINSIIVETIKHCNCETLLVFSQDELKIQSCKINLDFLIEFYQ